MKHPTLARTCHTLMAALCALLWHTAVSAQTTEEKQLLDFGLACTPIHDAVKQEDRTDDSFTPKSRPDRPLTQPDYPPIARRMGAEGTVIMNLLITADGRVSQAQVDRSSGHEVLDAAALEATRNWQMSPGKLDGEAVCMWGKFSVSFKLTDYLSEDLATAIESPEARELAQLLLGVDTFISNAGAEYGTATAEHKVRDILTTALREHEDWSESHDRAARILAFEFSPEELQQLLAFHATPVAKKMQNLSPKLLPEFTKLSGQLFQHLQCTTSLLQESAQRQNISLDAPAMPLLPQHEAAIKDYVNRASTYCDCALRHINDRLVNNSEELARECNLPPQLSLSDAATINDEQP